MKPGSQVGGVTFMRPQIGEQSRVSVLEDEQVTPSIP